MVYKKNKTVLIVEDNEAQAMHLEYLLSCNGLASIYACDGEEGLYFAYQHQPDIIVLNNDLPDMEGVDLCRLLKENKFTNPIPIIFFADLAREESATFGTQTGEVRRTFKDELYDMTLLEALRTRGMIEKICVI